MSIDSRLREGLRAEADAAVANLDWSDVLVRTGKAEARARTYRLVGLAAAAAVAVALIVSGTLGRDDDIEPAPPPPSPSASTPEPLAVEGSWTTGELPVTRIVRQLKSEGLGRWSDRVFDGESPPATYAVDLRLSGGEVSTIEWRDGTTRGQVDHQTFIVTGRTITFTVEDGSCASVLRWQVTANLLSLRVVSNDCPAAFAGVPDEAYIQKLYAAAPFRRVTE